MATGDNFDLTLAKIFLAIRCQSFHKSLRLPYWISEKMATCEICLEAKRGKQILVVCQSCKSIACMDCLKQWFKSTKRQPVCFKLECCKEWTDDGLKESGFSSKYIATEIKALRVQHLLVMEELKLPQAQALVQDKRQKETILKEIQVIDQNIEQLRARKRNREQALSERPRVQQVMHACPQEGCRGYIMDSHQCGLCATVVCATCWQLQTDTHVCDPNVVASLREVSHASKPCPKCHVPIIRSEGCTHMFCSRCHTCFCWDTLRIQSENTNPDFHQWRKQEQEKHGQVSTIEVGQAIKRQGNFRSSDITMVFNAIDMINNPHRVQSEPRGANTDPFERVRMMYVEGTISKRQWHASVANIYTQISRQRQLADIAKDFSKQGLQLLQTFCQATSVEASEDLLRCLQELRADTNQKYMTLHWNYGIVVPQIAERFSTVVKQSRKRLRVIDLTKN